MGANTAFRRELLRELGVFDCECDMGTLTLTGGDVYGCYLVLAAGYKIVYTPEALIWHYHRRDFASLVRMFYGYSVGGFAGLARMLCQRRDPHALQVVSLASMRSEGRNNMLLGQKHPELRGGLRCIRQRDGMRVVFDRPGLCYAGMLLGLELLSLYEWLNLRGSWRRLYGKLRHYAYWRGVQESLGSWKAFGKYCADVPAYARYEIDISDGLPSALPPLGRDGVCRVAFSAGGRELSYFIIDEPLAGDAYELLADWIATALKSQLWTYLAESELVPWAAVGKQLQPG